MIVVPTRAQSRYLQRKRRLRVVILEKTVLHWTQLATVLRRRRTVNPTLHEMLLCAIKAYNETHEAQARVCVQLTVFVRSYLGSVLLISLKSSLKYCGARTMTGSEEGMTRAGSLLVSTTAFTKPCQSNYSTQESEHMQRSTASYTMSKNQRKINSAEQVAAVVTFALFSSAEVSSCVKRRSLMWTSFLSTGL